MEVQYQITEDEFADAQLQFCSKVLRPNRLLLQFLMAVSLIVLGIVVLLTTGLPDRDFGFQDHMAEWFGIIFGSYLLANRYVFAPYRLRRIFHRSPNTSCERRLLISDAGIKTILPNVTDEALWGAFQKAYDLKNVILVMYSPRQFYIIPTRVFDAAGLDEFRSILRAKGLL